jgi:putative ABC transport system substrate-binding protein
VEVAPKRLELLHELVPAVTVAGLLVNPKNPLTESISTSVQAAARALGVELHVIAANTDREIDSVFSRLSQLRVGLLAIGTDPFFTSRSERLGALALRNAMPAIFQYRAFAAAGGLMSYGGNITESYYRAGSYVGRILQGEKPSDLPVQLSAKVELILNIKSARVMGLTVPLPLLGRADEVIE